MYKELGEECVQVGCSVDLFITNNSFIDLPTIGQISKISGGEIFKYTYFQVSYCDLMFCSYMFMLSFSHNSINIFKFRLKLMVNDSCQI